MKFTRLLGFAALGVLALGAGLVGLVAWKFLVPSAAARELEAVYAHRPTAVEADNAYFYLWGFQAPDGADPVELARKRIAWALEQGVTLETTADDPLPGDANWMTMQRSPAMKRLLDDCRIGAAAPCAAAFREWPLDAGFSAVEKLQATRYAALLARPRWYELVPYQVGLPLLPFSDALDAQRVWLLQARAAARAGDAARVGELLDRDLAFWREASRSSDVLISKVMALVAIRNSLFFGNLALRELPPAQQAAAIPASWREPFTAEELSLQRAIAGEFHWTSSYMWKQNAEGLEDYDDDVAADAGYSDAELLVENIAQRFRPRQRRLNQFADYLVASLRAFDVPLDRYPHAEKEVGDRHRPNVAYDISTYVFRVGSVEGMRRAALLIAELRSRGVPPERVAAELTTASVARDPFTLKPFEWDPVQRAVIYTDPRDPRWRRLTYFY